MTNTQFRPGGFRLLPPVVKNLLIINGLFFLATISLQSVFKIDLNSLWGLYYIGSDKFQPFQFLTYMFLHGDITHLFFNMFAFWMFGNAIENVWGPKRFIIYYFATGLGAAFLHQLVQFIEVEMIISNLTHAGITSNMINEIITSGKYNPGILEFVSESDLFSLYRTYNGPTVGASGSVFGILLAFGMLFPNALIYLYFAIPVKAKWLVIGYGALELWSGLAASPGDNVAHFAHLGGMIFGFILIKIWKKKSMNRWM
ncbi:MAG: rhomboid family intramembrane serine protease [Bacteroidales bacterium]|nr:rhomboid family intramembrane serine protease [Bacteroidales bacterium]